MSLRNTQKPLSKLLEGKETASIIVAIPAGQQPASVMTASYTVGYGDTFAIFQTNSASKVAGLSPFDGTSLKAVDAVPKSVKHLLKVGECASCSSDLYADNATADSMQEHAHFGACVLCGSSVSYANTGELAQIATSIERKEHANYFDFSELNTVDPLLIEENDMSTNTQARKALRASVAASMQAIREQASEEDSVDVVPSDDEDFAEGDDTEELDAVDMDESDPSEDEEEDSDAEEDTSDEEAADTNTETLAETPAVEAPNTEAADVNIDAATNATPAADAPAVEAPAVEAPAADVVVASEDETPAAEAPAADVVETADTDEAPAAEVEAVEAPAEVAEVAADDATIEYVATTPANLSVDAELVATSETAYYVVQDSAPVAVLRKENASAGAQSIWHKPSEMRNAFRSALAGDRNVALASLGGEILTHKTVVASVIAERVTASETAAQVEIATERAGYSTKMQSCLEVAALGIVKGMFGAEFANPVANELVGVLTANGVSDPRLLVQASMLQSMPKLVELLLAKAVELSNESDDSLSAQAALIGTSEFIAPVTNIAPAPVEAPAAAPAPVETASVKRNGVDVAALTAHIGRRR